MSGGGGDNSSDGTASDQHGEPSSNDQIPLQDLQARSKAHVVPESTPPGTRAQLLATEGLVGEVVADPYEQEHHVVFCVPIKDDERSAQVRVKKLPSDKIFFDQLRAEYKGSRGLLRYYLSPKRFWYCQFSRMESWASGQLVFVKAEVPPDDEKDYLYRPRPPAEPYVEPIRPDEWYKRFHKLIDTGDTLEALPLIPKRCKVFEVSTHLKGREKMWGLHVEYRMNVCGVFAYSALMIVGPLVFWIWWLQNHPNDWQTATTLLTTVLTMLTAIWYIGGEEFQRRI